MALVTGASIIRFLGMVMLMAGKCRRAVGSCREHHNGNEASQGSDALAHSDLRESTGRKTCSEPVDSVDVNTLVNLNCRGSATRRGKEGVFEFGGKWAPDPWISFG